MSRFNWKTKKSEVYVPEKFLDYEKLIREFGISPMKDLPALFNENVLFRRKVVFAHRDIQRILEAIQNKKKFVMMNV
jgi:hypothetical protein